MDKEVIMEKQNVTLSLPKTLLKRAKILATLSEKSLSQLMKESLEEKVRSASGYDRAKDRQFKYLNQGFELGTKGQIDFTREEIHAR